MMSKAEKRALLQAVLSGNASTQQIASLRKSREPIQLTMILDEETAHEVPDPQYCIDIFKDGTTHCYDRYADGRIVTRDR